MLYKARQIAFFSDRKHPSRGSLRGNGVHKSHFPVTTAAAAVAIINQYQFKLTDCWAATQCMVCVYSHLGSWKVVESNFHMMAWYGIKANPLAEVLEARTQTKNKPRILTPRFGVREVHNCVEIST